MSKILPPKENEKDTVQFSVTFPRSVVNRLDAIALEEGYSRGGVVLHFVKWALEEFEREKRSKK